MLCYDDIKWKTSAHQGLVCRWRSPISVLCSYVLFTSSTVLCPPPSSAVAYLMCSEHRPLACCVVLCCTVRASWWLSLVVPVWCGGTRRKWVRGNNSVPQASTIVTRCPPTTCVTRLLDNLDPGATFQNASRSCYQFGRSQMV